MLYGTVLFLGQCYNNSMKRTHTPYKLITRFICTFFSVFLVVFSSATPAKADTIQAHGTVSTSYGSYTWSAQQAASTLPITVSLPYVGISFVYNSGTSFSIDYSLKNQYSGIVTITVTGNNTWSVDNVNILTSGCNLDSLPSDHAQYKTSHSFNLRLKNSDKFSFVIYGAGTTVFLGSTSVSVAHNMSVDNLEQQIDATLDLYLPGMSNSLSGLGYDANTGTSLSADTLAYDMAIVKNYIDEIEGQLSANNHYIDQIESYIDDIEGYLSALNQLNLPLYSYAAYRSLTPIGTLVDFRSSGVNYDYFQKAFRLNTSWSYNNNYVIPIYPGTKLEFVFYMTINTGSLWFQLLDSSGNVYQFTQKPIFYVNELCLNHYTYENTSSNTLWVQLVPKNTTYAPYIIPLYLGNYIPSSLAADYGLEIDNTYTRLLQGIINAVGTISQQQIIENNTNINNYNNYQTQINNVENNYYNEYNTYNTDIQNNNTFDFSGLSSDGVTVYHNLFTSVFQIDLIKWPLIIILLGLIVVIILG